ncbi:FAD/NAD(P)-binding protein [Umezawaea endophytica]|uniref:FAD/NAD(P)-binding protein n=1 Tax=Umezawaea endophytica TaxID=1654476 RepID=A0A9X2VHU3_9PSEU|nr:FAD/NAD(P)-binding protein [Umezawaea endophytica]MCS7476898.1 FAD/NAD(P)-binding protein [Umezawaea endophytica]
MTTLGIIGGGPRALSVLERLAVRATAAAEPVEVHLIDPVQVGCGRVWRTDQPDWFLMNTVAGEITAFSGPPDSGPPRPGAGPSFAQWWDRVDPSRAHANDYAPRRLYGRYLLFLLDAIERALPTSARVHRVTAMVEDLRELGPGGYRLILDDGSEIDVDRAVLVTGHARPRLSGHLLDLRRFARTRPSLRFIPGDSAADMPLSAIPPGSGVGVIGMGLTFYDVVAALTVGRGGRFEESPDGLVYSPSGEEPFLVAGSRSGVPQPARGRNRKPSDFAHRPVFFTEALVRSDASAGRLDFREHLLPRLMAEVDFVHRAAVLRERSGPAAADDFVVRVREKGGASLSTLDECAADFGVADVEKLDFDRLSFPFADRTFTDRTTFDAALVNALAADVDEAERGNVDSPVKAALDVLRSLRATIRELTDFGGLLPESHRADLIGWYAPRSAFLAAGPPLVRLRETKALIEAGVLRVIGPRARYAADAASGTFRVSSPCVLGASVAVDTVIDARIPSPDVGADTSPLSRALLRRGLWREFVNGGTFHTGGVEVTRSPFHPVGADGRPVRGLSVLGIPTEHSRFFTQVVATGPAGWSEFMRDADDVAQDVLRPVEHQTDHPLAIGGPAR